MFEQNSALAHRACKMVAFLDREMPDFVPLCCLVLHYTMNTFHQWTRLSLPLKEGSNWQHQLRHASLYSWHNMMSALRHDWRRIFNQLPYFVKIFWISVSSATTGKNFGVNWSSFEWIMKRNKQGSFFMKHRVLRYWSCPSVCPSFCPIRPHNLKRIRHRKIKIGINVPSAKEAGMPVFSSSKVKLTGSRNLRKMTHSSCKDGLAWFIVNDCDNRKYKSRLLVEIRNN